MSPSMDGLAPTPTGLAPGIPTAPAAPVPKSPLGAASMRTCQSSVMTAVQYPVRSIGADAFAVGGGPPRPPRPWAWTTEGAASQSRPAVTAHSVLANAWQKHLAEGTPLLHGFAGTRAPGFAICCPGDFEQACAVTARTARRVSYYFNRISNPKGVSGHARLRKLGGGRAFDRPALHRPVGGLGFDEEERVGRPDRNLNDLSFNGYFLRNVVGSAKGGVGFRGQARKQHRGGDG